MTANFLAAVASHEQLLRMHPDYQVRPQFEGALRPRSARSHLRPARLLSAPAFAHPPSPPPPAPRPQLFLLEATQYSMATEQQRAAMQVRPR
jgi:hypothetical protein